MPVTVKLPGGVLTCSSKRIAQMIDASDQQSATHMSRSDRFIDLLRGLFNTSKKKSKLDELWDIKQRTTITGDPERDAILFISAISQVATGDKHSEIILSQGGRHADFRIANDSVYRSVVCKNTERFIRKKALFHGLMKNTDELTASAKQEKFSDTLNTLTASKLDRGIIEALYGALYQPHHLLGDNIVRKVIILARIRDWTATDKQSTITVQFNDDGMNLCINQTVIHRCPVSSMAEQFIREHCLNNEGTLKNTVEFMRQAEQYRAANTLQQALPQFQKFNAIMDSKKAHSRALQGEIREKIQTVRTLQKRYEKTIQTTGQQGNDRRKARIEKNLNDARDTQARLTSDLEFAKIFTTEYHNQKGTLTWYHDASTEEQKYPKYMYAPHQKEMRNLSGSEKQVTHRDDRFVVLAPNNSNSRFKGKNLRYMVGLSSVIPDIPVTPDTMIARNGGEELARLQHPVSINAFQDVLNDSVTLDKLRLYLLDLKPENLTWQGKNKRGQADETGIARIIDSDGMVTGESTGTFTSYTPAATTRALIKACFIPGQPSHVKPCFRADDPAENSRFFNSWQQYSLALAIMAGTTADPELKSYLFAPEVDTLGYVYPGALNPKSQALFQTWMDRYIKPEYQADYSALMSNPAQYAARADAPYLRDMILLEQTS